MEKLSSKYKQKIIKKLKFKIIISLFIFITIIFLLSHKSFGYTVLIPSQTIYQISANNTEYIKFNVYHNAILTGSFITTENITIYLLTPYEYFSLNELSFSYIETTGKANSGSIKWLISPGTYYLVFDNRNIIFNTNVMIQNQFELLNE